MRSEVTEAGRFEKMLTVHLDEAELEDAKNAAARKLAGQLKIKGFRPGKAPRAVVERMVGTDAVRSEAIDDSLGEFVNEAITEAELAPVTSPRVEEIRDTDEGGLEVAVRITLWPKLDAVPDFSGRKIEVEVPEVDDEELDGQIDRLRNQFAELEDVSREADDGDFVMINVSAHGPRGEVEEVAANDLLYEIGSHSFIPGLDEILGGSSTGDIREGPGTLPPGLSGDGAEEVTLKVLVKGVRAKKLPDVTDEWVADVTEFDTVDELRTQVAENMLAMKMSVVDGAFREQLVAELSDELDVELPDALVEAEMEASLHNLYHSLESQGLDLNTYLSVTGQDQEAFVADLRERAGRALKTRILLETVAETEGIEVEEDELEEAVLAVATQAQQEVDEVREALATSGQGLVLSGDILRRKALDRLVAQATPVDADGNPVDLDISVEDGDADQMDAEEAEAETATDEDSAPDADNVSEDE